MLSSRRIVRNPITGEEIVYEKGQKPVQHIQPQQQANTDTSRVDPDQRVKELLDFKNLHLNEPTNSTNLNHNQAPVQQPTKSRENDNQRFEFMSQVASTSSNMATKGGSSIPMLNFNDLASEDRPSTKDTANNEFSAKTLAYNANNRKINYKHELSKLIEKQGILSDMKAQKAVLNPIFGISSVEAALINSSRNQNSSRPKESDAMESPLIRFQNQLMQEQEEAQKQKISPLVSKLEAPRDPLTQKPADTNKNNDSSKENSPHILNLDHLNMLPKGPLSQKKDSIYKIERVADLEKLWLESGGMTPMSRDESRNNTGEKAKFMKEKLVTDTIFTDQLSKFPSSNPMLDHQSLKYKTIYTARGNRHTIIDNHITPISSLSENTLSKKCKFSCRVRTPNGKIALRELFGILFMYDSSLTIYEFRLLCGAGSSNSLKKSTALPFINRKIYQHAFGRKKGKSIEIWDLYRGSILCFPTNVGTTEESSLPTTARHSEYVEIEITDVDEVDKENLLTNIELGNISLSSHEMSHNAIDIRERLKQPLSDMEINDKKILGNIRMFLRKQIESRSVEVYMGVSRSLKEKSRRNGSAANLGHVSLSELHDSLVEYNIQIHSEDLNIAWQVLDLNEIGYLSYYVLLRALFGEMSIARHNQFRTLMRKLDSQKTGYIQINDIYKYYKVARHPRVRSGEVKEEDFKSNFLSSFEQLNPSKVPEFFALSTTTDFKSPIIAYEQFEEYYNGLSITVDTDDDFLKILKNSWNLS
jgi:Ca2+-binding EF-hand superfamily protein